MDPFLESTLRPCSQCVAGNTPSPLCPCLWDPLRFRICRHLRRRHRLRLHRLRLCCHLLFRNSRLLLLPVVFCSPLTFRRFLRPLIVPLGRLLLIVPSPPSLPLSLPPLLALSSSLSSWSASLSPSVSSWSSIWSSWSSVWSSRPWSRSSVLSS